MINQKETYNGPASQWRGETQRIGDASDCIAQPPHVLPIPDALSRLDETTRVLCEVVGHLEKRLNAVLQNDVKACGNKCELPKDADYSLLGHINSVNNKVYLQTEVLQNIINRLAL